MKMAAAMMGERPACSKTSVGDTKQFVAGDGGELGDYMGGRYSCVVTTPHLQPTSLRAGARWVGRMSEQCACAWFVPRKQTQLDCG
jgi:hypothetical protein